MIHHQLWLSIDGHDLVTIDRSRLGGVVSPLERLDRVFRGGHWCAIGGLHVVTLAWDFVEGQKAKREELLGFAIER